MLTHYLKTTVKVLNRSRLFSAINIVGLAVGLAACILIALFVRDELSYDRQWAHSDTIGRINTTVSIPGRGPFVSVSASSPMKAALEQFFPNEVVRATRFIPVHPIVRLDDNAFAEDMYLTDPETALMFDIEVVEGDLLEALQDQTSLVVSEQFARKYFGSGSALGRVLNVKVFEIDRDYRIAAVFRDLPHNTSLDFEALARFDLGDFPRMGGMFDTWLNLGEHLVYVQVDSPASFSTVNAGLPRLVDARVSMPDSLRPSAEAKTSESYIATIQPLRDIHLNPSGMGEMKPTGNIRTVRVFIAAAALLLLIACINFMNLATANATRRAREVALRKVVGARRRQLVAQFLGESVLMAALALAVALLLVQATLPLFNSLLGTALNLTSGGTADAAWLLILVVIVGVAAGAYPALVLSGFLPARVLGANQTSAGGGSVNLRNALVLVQFVISIALIVATATVYAQSFYVEQTDLGYQRENVVVLNNVNHEFIADRKQALKEAIEQMPGVLETGFTDYSPVDIHERLNGFQLLGDTDSPEAPPVGQAMISTQSVDHDFLDAYGVVLVAGRFYRRDFIADGMPGMGVVSSDPGDATPTGTVVINEEAVRQLGLTSPADAIGRRLRTGFGPEAQIELEIIGVTGNIFFQSPRKPIRAETYLLAPQRFNTLAIRFDSRPAELVRELETLWNGFTNRVPFQYEFVAETVAAEFVKERNLAVVLAAFALTTVLVACLGLYGLAAFTAQRRTKEIGIRKVMGATVTDIVRLLLWQFSRPVLLANLIALPLAAWIMLRWLDGFPVRLDSWLLAPFCLAAGLLAAVIAWATVSTHTAAVARARPVNALRYE